MSLSGQTWWIVGASEGLGRALARSMAAEGVRLILSARNAERLETLAADLPGASTLPLDVTDPAAVAKAWAAAGEIDGMLYCAGAYDPMTATDWQAEAAQRMVAVNFTGAMHVLSHVAPAFGARGAGHIVLIGSLAGYRGLPGAIGYGASKAALMNLGESLYADLAPSGVKVQVVSPGFIRTRLTDKNDFDMPQIMTPEAAAARVLKAMRGGRLSTAFPRPFSLLFSLGRLLPAGLFYRIFR